MSGGDKCPDTFRIHDWTNEPASGGEGAAGSDDCSVLIALVIDHDVTMTSRCCCEHLLLLLTTTDVPAARQLVVNFFYVREF